MTRRNIAGQPDQILVWDEGRRLAEVRESGSVVAEFLYAVDDTRVRRKVDDSYTFYHADGTEYSFDADGGEGYFTYYHQMSGRMIGFTRSDSGVMTWTGSDIVGSTSATSGVTGSTIAELEDLHRSSSLRKAQSSLVLEKIPTTGS